jgi:hypothetical protein
MEEDEDEDGEEDRKKSGSVNQKRGTTSSVSEIIVYIAIRKLL